MIERGKFIVFEGAGGSGKSTIINHARNILQRNNIETIITREPGGSETLEKIRNLVFEFTEKAAIGPEAQAVLFLAVRGIHVDEVIIPNLHKGICVMTDRFNPSTNAYQGYGGGGDRKKIETMAQIVSGHCRPDAVILLNISTDTFLSRRARDANGDPYDKLPLDYHQRLISGYQKMAEEKWGGLNWYIVDANKSLKLVESEVVSVLKEIFRTNLTG